MPVIKIGGKGKKPTVTSSKRTSSAKRTSATKSAKRVGTAKKAVKATGTKRTVSSAKKNGGGPGSRGPRTPKIDSKVLNTHVKALKRAGDARRKAEDAHNEAVNDLHAVAQAAIEAEVPMSVISRETGVSRQWLYKMGQFRERTNGNGRKGRATKAARSSKSSATKTCRPRVRSK